MAGLLIISDKITCKRINLVNATEEFGLRINSIVNFGGEYGLKIA